MGKDLLILLPIKNHFPKILQDGINQPPPGDTHPIATHSPRINASKQKNTTTLISSNLKYPPPNLLLPAPSAKGTKNQYPNLY